MSQDFEWKYCDYEDNSRSSRVLHQELLHGGSNNEDTRTPHEIYCQDFECEMCIDEAKAGSELIVHEET